MLPRPWTPKEDAYLRESVNVIRTSEMAKALDRTGPSVWGRIYALGLEHRKPYDLIWSSEDEETLRSLHGIKAQQEIAQVLRRSRSAIRVKLKRLGLLKKRRAYSLLQASKMTGYLTAQLQRARKSLDQRWGVEKYNKWTRYTITPEQLEALCEYLKTEPTKGQRAA